MATIEDGKRYRWAYPSDWLLHRLERYRADGNVEALFHVGCELYAGMPEDDIQDRFQDEMDADGYFTPLKGRVSK